MFTPSQALALALASIVLIAVPGPSVMFVVGRALSYGRRNALASVAGNAIGCYLVGVVIALGLGSLLEKSDMLFQVIKWGGILYLMYLGIQAIRHAAPVQQDASATLRAGSLKTAIRTGTIVGLTNPKSFILFTVLVPQFIVPAAGNIALQIILLGVIPLLIGLVTDTAWALSAGRARTWLANSPRRMTTMGRIGGFCLVGVGLTVAVSGDHR